MKNQKSGTETGWHVTWPLPMPECRALAADFREMRETVALHPRIS
jgi:hypothetical protein